VGDGDLVLVSGSLILSSHVQNSVHIDLERHLNLGNSTGRGRHSSQIELAQLVVVLRHGTLSLEHLDGDGGLVVSSSGEDLRLLRGDHSVARDDLGHDSSHSFDTHRQRVHIEQDDVASVLLSRDHSSLNSGSVGDGLIGVDASGWLLSIEELLDQLLHLGDASGSSHQHNLVHVVLLQIRILEHLRDGLHRGTEQVHVELLELGTSECLREVFSVEDRFNLHLRLMLSGQGSLRLLNLSSQLLHCSVVLSEILASLLLVQFDEVLHHSLVEVLSSQVGISVRSQHLEDSVVDGEHGHIEGSS
ncbi:hypothetical protein PMAYCL1PPCAC_02009, partial [Pristionchus mayeri]